MQLSTYLLFAEPFSSSLSFKMRKKLSLNKCIFPSSIWNVIPNMKNFRKNPMYFYKERYISLIICIPQGGKNKLFHPKLTSVF